jgi:hypothetical protein
MLDPMSDEQREIYNIIAKGENAIGDACAGSGKSTTILSIATLLPHLNFIQLTYNSMLCSEIKDKVDKLQLKNINVYTYHSLVVKYYNSNGYTDTVIRKVLSQNISPREPIPRFNVIVLDETQDMTYLYFRIVVKFCKDMKGKIQLLILGDYMQGLYEFKGADIRFLTRANEIWCNYDNLCSPIFNICYLKMSYRITQPMADFVNNIMLGEKRLYACRDGEPVVYIRQPTYNTEKYIIYTISSLLKEGAVPEDFFVLGASVKGNNNEIRKIENALVENNIPCHVPIIEDDKIDERVIRGKIVFSTFHSVKGRQRKYVFIVGFNNSYFDYFARTLSQNECPNTLYVAATRATHGLFVIERNNFREDRPLKFLKMNHIEMDKQHYIKFNGIKQLLFDEDKISSVKTDKKVIRKVTPTELIKFISETVLEDINPILDKIFIKTSNIEDEIEIDIPNITQTQNKYFEDVSDLNGIAIPMLFFDHICNNNQTGILLINLIYQYINELKPNEHTFLKKYVDEIPQSCNNVNDYLYLSNVYYAVKEKLYFKLKQINNNEYNWLPDETIQKCFCRMNKILSISNNPTIIVPNNNNEKPSLINFKIEETIIDKNNELQHKNIDDILITHFPTDIFRFSARVDLITDNDVWEIKCTNSITNEHLLQVVIYAWLWRTTIEDILNFTNVKEFKIFNVKSGVVMRLDATTDELNYIVISLLKSKYGEKEIKKDGDFIEECKSVFTKNENIGNNDNICKINNYMGCFP